MIRELPFLSLNQVTARSTGKILFESLTFQVNVGEQWALVGASGSGKSALLHALAGQIAMTGGQVSFHFYERYLQAHAVDDPVFHAHKLMAMVPQKHSFKNLSNTTEFYYQQRYNAIDSENSPTVLTHLSGIRPVPVKSAPAWTLERVVTTFRLEDLLQKQLIKLSNGETRRLLFAGALLRNPLLLLLDNPFTGLDIHSRQQMNGIINQIADSGITMIMAVSPQELPPAITHVAVMEGGRIAPGLPKRDFDPESIAMGSDVALDEAELRALLSVRSVPEYSVIAAMKEVSIVYGEATVLDRINWEVKQGESWALTGPNGAGKSSLLSLINGDNPQAYANRITLFDRRRGSGESIWDIKKKIGYVSPEMLQYFPDGSTCLQVVESGFYDTQGLFRASTDAFRKLSSRWMKILEIGDLERYPFKKAPASAQRLCLLARALVKNPVLLILDEPCQGLDSHQQARFKNLVDAIHRLSNLTLIYVTHYPGELPECVTRFLKLEKGKVVD